MDIADKIMTNATFSHDDKQAKADIEKAAKDDATLLPRLKSPQTDADKDLLDRLIQATAAMDKPPTNQADQDWSRPEDAGRKSLLDTLKDDKGGFWSATDTKGSLTAVQNMTAAEQKQYRDNSGTPPYRDQVDKAVAENLTDPVLLHAAQRMLSQVKGGDAPTLDAAAKLSMETDQVQALHDMQQSFADDPKLRDRINSPTPADKQFSDDYKAAMDKVFTDPEQGAIYSQYTDALLKSGKMSLELSAQLDREGGVEKLATDIANASPEERARLGTDKAYRDNVLSAMSDQQKEIALAVAEKESSTRKIAFAPSSSAGAAQAM